MRNLKRVLALAMAMVMILGMMVIGSSAASYADAAAIDDDYAVAVEVLSGMGIFKGQDTGFAPKATLTRAEAAALIYRVITTDVKDSKIALYDYASFSDVVEGYWATGYITYAANGGYVKGDGTGKFNPNDKVTGVQVLAMLLRAAGYGQKGEFEGAAWKDNVLTTADDLYLLDNVKANDLDKPATRELVAQLIWDALWANTTTYTPAWGYYTSSVTLGDKFNLRAAEKVDVFNRPSEGYTYKTGDKATWYYAPVATYTTAVTQCKLSTDLGETGTWTAQYSLNGAGWNDTTKTVTTTKTISATQVSPAAAIGGQGTLTEVFLVGFEADGTPIYRITSIETWLAKVANVKKATYDYAGHMISNSETQFEVYGGSNINVVTEAYAKNSYALLTWSAKTGKVVDITPVTPVATDKLTAYTGVTTTVGATYANAAKFALGVPTPTNVGKVFNVFCDLYGNVIGLTPYVPAATVYNYGIITDIAWQASWGLADEYILANLLGVTNTAIPNVTIGNAWTNAGYNAGTFNSSVGYNKAANADYYDVLAKWHVDAFGRYVVDAFGTPLTNITTNPTKSYIDVSGVKYVVNDNTVYLVKTMVAGKPVYTSYTGYQNVPAMTGADATFFADKNNAYMAYIFIDATTAAFPGTSNTVFVFDTAVDVYGSDYVYYAWNGAELVELTVNGQVALPGCVGEGTYVVTYNAAGKVTNMTLVKFDGTDAAKTATLEVAYCDGTVMRNTTATSSVSYGCDNMTVYVINRAAKTITVGTYEDVVGTTAYLYLNNTKTDVVTAYVYG